MTNETLVLASKLREQLTKLVAKQKEKFADFELNDGTKLYSPSEILTIGSEIYVVGDEDKVVAPDADHIIGEIVYTTVAGVVTAMKKVEPVEVEASKPADMDKKEEKLEDVAVMPMVDAAKMTDMENRLAVLEALVSNMLENTQELSKQLEYANKATKAAEEKLARVVPESTKKETTPANKANNNQAVQFDLNRFRSLGEQPGLGFSAKVG